MIRTFALVLLIALGGIGFVAEAAPAKKKCPRGTKLVGKKCKKVKKKSSTGTVAKAVSGKVGTSTISITPNAKAKTAVVKVTISCFSAEGQSISQNNGSSGSTVKFRAVLRLEQTISGEVSDPATGTAMSWQLTGYYGKATSMAGVFSGTATQPGSDGVSAGCSLPPTNLILR